MCVVATREDTVMGLSDNADIHWEHGSFSRLPGRCRYRRDEAFQIVKEKVHQRLTLLRQRYPTIMVIINHVYSMHIGMYAQMGSTIPQN